MDTLPRHWRRASPTPPTPNMRRSGAVLAALFCITTLAGLPTTAQANAEPPPTLDWRQANDDVGRFLRGHIDLLKTEPAAAPDPPPNNPVLTLEQALALGTAAQPGLWLREGASAQELWLQRQAWLATRWQVLRLWADAVASAGQARAASASADTARTGAALAQRMAQVGNWSAAQWQREQLQSHQADRAERQAQASALAAREALVRALSQVGDAVQWQLPATLPTLPPLPQPLTADMAPALAHQTLWELAEPQHPALAQARTQAQRSAQAAGPQQVAATQAWLAQQANVHTPAPPVLPRNQRPWSHALEAALQDSATAQGQAAALQSHLRLAWQRWLDSRADVTQTEQMLQTQSSLLDDMQRRYNGMLKSTWDLLASSAERTAAQARWQQAQHQHWLAHMALLHLLTGGNAADWEAASVAPASASPKPAH